MKFVQDKNQILCTRNGEDTVVCSFDAQLDQVPPHVEAKLAPAERKALDAWMADRDAVRSMSAGELVIDSLPALLDEAAAALASDTPIDRASLLRLKFSLRRLLGMLRLQQASAPAQTGAPAQMSGEQYLSQQLRELSEVIAA